MNTEINPEFQPLPVALLERMQSLRSRLHALVTQHFPDTALSHTAADFALLQRIVNADVLSADDASGWEAMGIAFGDGLTARVPGLGASHGSIRHRRRPAIPGNHASDRGSYHAAQTRPGQ